MRFGPFFFTLVASFGLALPQAIAVQARSRAQVGTGCWDPEKDPMIQKFFQPNPKFHEDAKTMQLIHDTIWSHREDIDPRLVYHRMIGEAMGDPYVQSPDKKYYGLFQFGGVLAGTGKTQKSIIQSLYKQNPRVSPRLVQVRYYLETYLPRFKNDADAGRGCKSGKTWASYTNLERAVYLNQGRCNSALLAHERAYCTSKSPNKNYTNFSCSFAKPVLDGRASRLCERQNPGTRSVPVRSRASTSGVRAPAAKAGSRSGK